MTEPQIMPDESFPAALLLGGGILLLLGLGWIYTRGYQRGRADSYGEVRLTVDRQRAALEAQDLLLEAERAQRTTERAVYETRAELVRARRELREANGERLKAENPFPKPAASDEAIAAALSAVEDKGP